MRRFLFVSSILFFITLFLWWHEKEPKSSIHVSKNKPVASVQSNSSSAIGKVYSRVVPKIKEDNGIESLKNNPTDFAALESVLESFDFEKNSNIKIQIEADLRKISETCKNCSDLKLLAGETALKNAHFESARDVFKDILREDPNNQAAKRKLIEANTKLNEYEEASVILEGLIEERSAEIARLAALGESTKMHEKFLAEDRREYLQFQQQLN